MMEHTQPAGLLSNWMPQLKVYKWYAYQCLCQYLHHILKGHELHQDVKNTLLLISPFNDCCQSREHELPQLRLTKHLSLLLLWLLLPTCIVDCWPIFQFKSWGSTSSANHIFLGYWQRSSCFTKCQPPNHKQLLARSYLSFLGWSSPQVHCWFKFWGSTICSNNYCFRQSRINLFQHQIQVNLSSQLLMHCILRELELFQQFHLLNSMALPPSWLLFAIGQKYSLSFEKIGTYFVRE
jgi:hypothetical protein